MKTADAPGEGTGDTHPPEEEIGEADRQVLRRLAGRVAELAAEVLSGAVTEQKDIKKRVRNWRVDNDRV